MKINTSSTTELDELKCIQENLSKWEQLCNLDEQQLKSIENLFLYNPYMLDEHLVIENSKEKNDVIVSNKVNSHVSTYNIQNLDKVCMIILFELEDKNIFLVIFKIIFSR